MSKIFSILIICTLVFMAVSIPTKAKADFFGDIASSFSDAVTSVTDSVGNFFNGNGNSGSTMPNDGISPGGLNFPSETGGSDSQARYMIDAWNRFETPNDSGGSNIPYDRVNPGDLIVPPSKNNNLILLKTESSPQDNWFDYAKDAITNFFNPEDPDSQLEFEHQHPIMQYEKDPETGEWIIPDLEFEHQHPIMLYEKDPETGEWIIPDLEFEYVAQQHLIWEFNKAMGGDPGPEPPSDYSPGFETPPHLIWEFNKAMGGDPGPEPPSDYSPGFETPPHLMWELNKAMGGAPGPEPPQDDFIAIALLSDAVGDITLLNSNGQYVDVLGNIRNTSLTVTNITSIDPVSLSQKWGLPNLQTTEKGEGKQTIIDQNAKILNTAYNLNFIQSAMLYRQDHNGEAPPVNEIQNSFKIVTTQKDPNKYYLQGISDTLCGEMKKDESLSNVVNSYFDKVVNSTMINGIQNGTLDPKIYGSFGSYLSGK